MVAVGKRRAAKRVRRVLGAYLSALIAFLLAVFAVVMAQATDSASRVDYFRYVHPSEQVASYPATAGIYLTAESSAALGAINGYSTGDVWSVVIDSNRSPARLTLVFGSESSIVDAPSTSEVRFSGSIANPIRLSLQLPEGAMPLDGRDQPVERGWCATWVDSAGDEQFAYLDASEAPGFPTIFTCTIPAMASFERLTIEARFSWSPASAVVNVAGKSSYAVANPAVPFFNGLQIGAIEPYANPIRYHLEFVNSTSSRLEASDPQAGASSALVSRWPVEPGESAFLAVRSTPLSDFAEASAQLWLIAAGAFFAIGAERFFDGLTRRRKRRRRKGRSARPTAAA